MSTRLTNSLAYRLALIAILFCATFVFARNEKPRIIKWVKDERCLTSIQYVKGNDTLAIDYMTPEELKAFGK